MKILNISLDKNVLDSNSAVAKRMVDYGQLADKFTILVLADENREFNLSGNVKVVSVKKSNKFFDLLKLKRKAARVLNSEKYDIITVQDTYFIGWMALKLAKKFHLGLEVQVHGFEKFSGVRKLLAKRVLKKANAVRVVSQRLKREVMRDFGVQEDRITTVPIYIDIVLKTGLPLQRRAGTPTSFARNDNSTFIFLTVGRLVPVKNVAMQIDALAEITKKFLQVELWIVGDGVERQYLEIKNQKLKIKNQIKFFGWQNDLEKFYKQADCLLLTSNNEGWGLAVVEAAAHGLPIIMTDVGLAGEVIKNGESGIVIPVGDRKALVEAMIKIIEDSGLRKKLGEGARKAIKTLPSKEETFALYKKSWELALKNKNQKI